MTCNQSKQSKYYFSQHLLARLTKIQNYALTFVEAPSGFGKTTAVREYLKANLPPGTSGEWYTCLGESPAKAWSGICALFSNAASRTAEDMLDLGVPTPETIPDLIDILRKYPRKQTRYIVIDNYQLFTHSAPRQLVDALAASAGGGLHCIVISQPLKKTGKTTQQSYPYHHVTAKDFFFDNICIAKYCRLQNISINQHGIERIQNISRGWVQPAKNGTPAWANRQPKPGAAFAPCSATRKATPRKTCWTSACLRWKRCRT